tara:strand:- start:301 stop:588 length:288 start_codon:yes stop_codon:yes gene_type:complete
MKVNFSNDLENNLMRMTIKVQKRNFVNEDKIMISWRSVEEILNEQYNAPQTHTLGACHDKWKKINNDHENLCEQVWIFDLLPNKNKKSTKKSKTA